LLILILHNNTRLIAHSVKWIFFYSKSYSRDDRIMSWQIYYSQTFPFCNKLCFWSEFLYAFKDSVAQCSVITSYFLTRFPLVWFSFTNSLHMFYAFRQTRIVFFSVIFPVPVQLLVNRTIRARFIAVMSDYSMWEKYRKILQCNRVKMLH